MRAKIGGAESHGFIQCVKRVRGAVKKEMEPQPRSDFFMAVMLRLACFLLALRVALPGLAQTSAPVTSSSVPVAKVAEAPAKTERTISPHVAELLATATTQFTLPKPAEKKPEQPTAVTCDHGKPANEIVRLPQVIRTRKRQRGFARPHTGHDRRKFSPDHRNGSLTRFVVRKCGVRIFYQPTAAGLKPIPCKHRFYGTS